VSVKAAIGNLNLLVAKLGRPLSDVNEHFSRTNLIFPTPEILANADLSFLRMPESRKQTLNRFGHYVAEHGFENIDNWLSIKGVGPWTIGYVKLRGINEPDCFLDSDLVIKKALAALPKAVDSKQLSPWGSYATFHLWQSQSE
jgi:AraC family transcriptional regulator of adaptative response / DNA-3-methyladenine glycosylase II